MDKSVLLNNPRVIITLIIEDDDAARIELQSTKKGPDLRNLDDVVVVVDGQGVPVEPQSERLAIARLGPWAPLGATGFELMIRVDTTFESWEFDPEGAPVEGGEDDEQDR